MKSAMRFILPPIAGAIFMAVLIVIFFQPTFLKVGKNEKNIGGLRRDFATRSACAENRRTKYLDGETTWFHAIAAVDNLPDGNPKKKNGRARAFADRKKSLTLLKSMKC